MAEVLLGLTVENQSKLGCVRRAPLLRRCSDLFSSTWPPPSDRREETKETATIRPKIHHPIDGWFDAEDTEHSHPRWSLRKQVAIACVGRGLQLRKSDRLDG